jgi:oligoendopeptidase F
MAALKINNTEWNLNLLFDGDEDPQMEEEKKLVTEKSYEFINKWKDRDDFLKDPKILKEALDEYEEWNRLYAQGGKVFYYFWLRTHQDQLNADLKSQYNKVEELYLKIVNDIQFFSIRVAKIPEENQKQFLTDAGLKDYKHFLEKAFEEAKYILSEPEEKIMNLKSKTSHENWVKLTQELLSKEECEVLVEKGKKEKKTFEELMTLMSDRNKEVRDSAAEEVNKIFEKYVGIAEAEMNSILGNKKVNDELRGYSRPDQGRHIGDDIDSDVVDTLVAAVSENFDIPKRYYELKSKLLGLPKLGYHERNVEYGDVSKEYSYEEGVELIHRVMSNLDKKLAEVFKRFVEEGQIDVYPRKGKSGGAFCVYWLPSHPTYILLNYTKKLNDITTIAHEFGHGVNNELIKEKQNALNFGTPMSTAEVASTFMEDFVLQEILREADDELRLTLLMQKLNDDISTVFRQIAAYMFEQELHTSFREKGFLSKEDIGVIFRKNMENYMGDFVEQSEGSQNWWTYWSHFRSFFYVYSYSSGLLISKSMQNSVKENPEFIEKVKEFLSAGLSDSPKNIFMKMGIDITDKEFWRKGIAEVEVLLKETEALAKKLGKI